MPDFWIIISLIVGGVLALLFWLKQRYQSQPAGTLTLAWQYCRPQWQRGIALGLGAATGGGLVLLSQSHWFLTQDLATQVEILVITGGCLLQGVILFAGGRTYYLTDQGLWGITTFLSNRPASPVPRSWCMVRWTDVNEYRLVTHGIRLYPQPPGWLRRIFPETFAQLSAIDVPLRWITPLLPSAPLTPFEAEILRQIQFYCGRPSD